MGRISYCLLVGGRCNKPELEAKVQLDTFFLAEPFKPEQERRRRERAVRTVLKEALKKEFHERSLRVADKEPRDPTIFCDICRLIQSSAYGIVDISGLNPNVLLELSMMFSLGKPVFVLVKKSEQEDLRKKLPSDIVWKRVIPYEEFIDVEEELSNQIQNRPTVELEPLLAEEVKKVVAEIDPVFAQEIDAKLQEIKRGQEERLKKLEKLLEKARLSETISREEEIKIPPSLEKQISELYGKVEWIEKLVGFSGDPSIAFLRGNWHFSRKEYDRALELYDWVLYVEPNFAEAWINKGVTLSNLGRDEEAIDCYDKAIEIKKDHVEAWFDKGFSLDNLGRYKEAIDCYDKAIEIKKDHSKAWVNKGVTLSKLGKEEESIVCFDRALEIDKDDLMAWFNKGHAFGELGKYKDAKRCYEKALRINPNDIGALENMSEVLLVLRDFEKGLKIAQKALRLAKDAEHKAISWFLCISAYLFSGKSKRAREEVEGLMSHLRRLEKGIQVVDWDFSTLLPTINEKLGSENRGKLLSLISFLKGEIGLEELAKRMKFS